MSTRTESTPDYCDWLGLCTLKSNPKYVPFSQHKEHRPHSLFLEMITASGNYVQSIRERGQQDLAPFSGITPSCMSESATRQQVWLIKAPPSGENEAYTDELLHAGFQPKYIPAIIERYETAELEDLLAQKDTKWDGVVITSRRGVEGWIRAAKAVVGQHSAECM